MGKGGKLKFVPEVYRFIEDHYMEGNDSMIASRISEELGIAISREQVHGYRSRKHLGKGGTTFRCRPSNAFSKEISDFIVANHKGVGPKEMAAMVSERFGIGFTKAQAKSFYANHKLSSGLTGWFEKGQEPWTKGKTWSEYGTPEGHERSRGTCFRKGDRPHNHVEVGTEVVKDDGYLWRKVEEPDKWRQCHLLLWEKERGPVPEGMRVCFLNNDRMDIRIGNLALVTISESAYSRPYRAMGDSDIGNTGVLIARCRRIAEERNKNERGDTD